MSYPEIGRLPRMSRRRARKPFNLEFDFARSDYETHPNQKPEDEPYPAVRCRLETNGDRWKTVNPYNRTKWTPKGKHVFVVQRGELVLNRAKWVIGRTNPIGHIDLAGGGAIEFGGEIQFGSSKSGRGILKWWNDRTGHYHDPNKPMDVLKVPLLPQLLFRPHEEE